AEQHFPTPHDSPLHAIHSHGSDEGSLKLNELMNLVTKLFDKIGVLEDDLRKTKKTYSSAFTKLILRGRKLSDAEVQEKSSTEPKPFIQEVTPTEVIQDQENNIGTARRTVTYRRRSEEKRTRKDKGKAIMTESKPKKKSKKELEQERLSFAEAIRLEEQMNKEQMAHISRDKEIARQWVKRGGGRGKRGKDKEVMSEAKSTKKIDWNDPSVISSKNYKVLSEMLEDFDRLDVEELYRLVKERYSASRPEGYDLMLSRDLHTLFKPDEEDEI
ncbi:hypothetical protein Tco_0994517, partial [Tanacetum coccineum]